MCGEPAQIVHRTAGYHQAHEAARYPLSTVGRGADVQGTIDMAEIPRTTLNNAVKIPQLGFGTYQVPPQQTAEVVTVALHTGYRHVDTAALYANEREVGQAIARSGLPRREVFVTTKLGNPNHGYDSALRAFDRSLRLLDLEVLDLYLIHWPQPRRDRYVETWRALEKLYADGRVRAIGVSNFQVGHLERLLAETDVVPAVNQVELSPYITQEPLRRFHQQHGIATESWSPLARGGRLLREPLLVSLAKKYGKSPAPGGASLAYPERLDRDTEIGDARTHR